MSTKYYNTLEIIGDEAQIEAVKKFIRGTQDELGEEVYFDINKVIKISDELKNEHEKLFGKGSRPYPIEDTSLKKLEEFYKMRQKCSDEYSSWICDDRLRYRNDYNQEIEDDSIIKYTTMYEQDHFVIEKLSQLFPEIIFVFITICDYPEDEIYHYKNGRIMKYIAWEYNVQTILNYNKNNKSISKSENRIIESLSKTKNGYYVE